MSSVVPRHDDIAQAFANAAIIALSDQLFQGSNQAMRRPQRVARKRGLQRQSHIVTRQPELESLVMMRCRHATDGLG